MVASCSHEHADGNADMDSRQGPNPDARLDAMRMIGSECALAKACLRCAENYDDTMQQVLQWVRAMDLVSEVKASRD